ncbi:MAG: AMP-binding protein [Labilithrix sp.]|nr:AMP-binding protein [Labilithrix sp.]MCW5815271.1 AMP-binding protein [Labilithrix sp.]
MWDYRDVPMARGPSLSRRLRASARNALELARFGRLGEDYSATFDIVDTGPHHRLRRYAGPADGPVALLVPPLMLTAEIYDVAPDTSAVSYLGDGGVSPWVVDFGAPEHERGGMSRSLDDHIRAIVTSIERVRAVTGKDVHLCGYSQGGMFAYQTAAFLRGEGIRSVVTFGSPVDIHKNLRAVRSDLAGHFAKTMHPLASALFERMEGLPGKLTSTAFKIVSTRKELEQRIDFLRSLHDRDRMVKREARRRFLGGGGFVAWPGPAFRAFVDEFVVHNRMMSGGFVIDGRTVSLADLALPILAFVGSSDEIARPATVRAIAKAAPDADVHFMTVRGGHFGIVVGGSAMAETWPAVAEWIKNDASLPPAASTRELDDDDDEPGGDLDLELDLAFDVAARTVKDAWRKLGEVVASANATVDTVRWQEPRLRRLASIEPETKISASRELARRAKETPDATFFLWRGRAFSFRDADTRVSNVARGLTFVGVRPGEKVGVWMHSRPSLLSTATALGRIGAIAVIAPPDAPREGVEDAFRDAGVDRIVVDPEHVGIPGALVLGGGSKRAIDGAFDMEAVDVTEIALEHADEGAARDLAMILLRPSEQDGALRAVPVTNHRWALSAIGAAAVCTVEPADTVLCAVPLHHPTGLLVSAGAALAGGARLALVEMPRKDYAGALVAAIRHAGATIVFYTGEMLRPLLEERADRHLPVRLFAGSGMRPALATRLRERFGVDTIEFYAGTAHRAILADASGDAPGSLGSVLPGSAEVTLVAFDPETRQVVRDGAGHLVHAGAEEAGLLAVKVEPDEILPGAIANAFADGGTWLVTNDVLERDATGKLWFVDALSRFVGGVSLRRVEDALYTLPEVQLAAAWESGGRVHAGYVAREAIAPERLLAALGDLPVHAGRVPEIQLTEGFRVLPPRVAPR